MKPEENKQKTMTFPDGTVLTFTPDYNPDREYIPVKVIDDSETNQSK